MNKTKIDWADMTWNPVTGCYHNCDYCYARKIANRFGDNYVAGYGDNYLLSNKASQYIERPELNDGHILMAQKRPIFKNIGILKPNGKMYSAYPFGFCPTFHCQRLFEPWKIKKPQTIFVCSMADLFGEWVPDKWIKQVFDSCERAPQHRYLFLTKNPARYRILQSKGALPTQHWYGTTATVNSEYFSHSDYRTFVSIEPMLRPVVIDRRPQQILPEWVIIGAETGNRKDKVIPERAWIKDVLSDCKFGYVPIFMKESLRLLMGDDFIQEFPWTESEE